MYIYFSFYICNLFVLTFCSYQLFIIIHRLNLCRKTAVETRKLCQKIVETVFVNSLNEVSPDFDHIVSTVINSMRTVDMDLNKDILLILIYRIHGIECKYSMFILIIYIISLLKSYLRIIIICCDKILLIYFYKLFVLKNNN